MENMQVMDRSMASVNDLMIDDVAGHLFFLAAIAAVALAGCINVNISNNGNNNGAGNNNGGSRR